MPRTARAIVAGHCYHLVNRGNNQATIFHEWADYATFLSQIARTQQCVAMPIIAACLMPNHLHLVVRPVDKDDLARWMQRLFTTHVRHHHRKYSTTGRLWQGRFKAFLIQEDEHLITVIRYVERNALRAGLVARAEQWRWGSLRWRAAADQWRLDLTAPPVPLPQNWVDYVNEPQTPSELESIRTSIRRGRPYGAQGWVEQQARELGLMQSLRPVGRPRQPRP
ncbi:MAG TPA: transposase [Steroidobacteraceae bacterium]|nr:transposase [Steroidobacteraceae bacterium]